jgi:hypothetical protein
MAKKLRINTPKGSSVVGIPSFLGSVKAGGSGGSPISYVVPLEHSIQSYDSQYDLKMDDINSFNFDKNDAFSISTKFRWDSSSEQQVGDNAVLLSNYKDATGWMISPRVATGDIRMLFADGTNSDIVTFAAGFNPVVGTTYALTMTHDGARNYKCYLDGVDEAPTGTSTPVTGSTVSTSPVHLGTFEGLTIDSNIRFRGMQNDIMFCDKAISLAEHTEWYNSASILDDYTLLSYSADVIGFFSANDGDSTGFASQVEVHKIGVLDGRDYFKLPYNLYDYNSNPTINATNYVNNPIVDGTSISTLEAYAGDSCTAPDGDIVTVVKTRQGVGFPTGFAIHKGVDFDNLVEININTVQLPNWAVNEVGAIRIRREGNTYYLIVRRQLNGSMGGAGERDICILETTDLTTNPNTWTQHLGIINKSMIPYEATSSGNWDVISPSDTFKYNGKYYMTAVCGNDLQYIHLFESNTLTSGWSWSKTLFDVNQQDWLNTLSPDLFTGGLPNLVQGGSIVKDGQFYYCCVTLGKLNRDKANERYMILGKGVNPFEFEFYKTVLHQAGADETYSERRVYDGQFIKKSDGNWLEPELIDSKYWLTYAGHSMMNDRPNAWDADGKLSLMSWTPNNLIS